jgi:predicted negative regulator of RcsB-dependent stress response
MAISHPRPPRHAGSFHSPKPIDQKTVVLLLSSVLLVSSAIGWRIARSHQAQKIQQASVVLDQACATNLTIDDNALVAAQQIDTAFQQLRSVPLIPGLGHHTAQAQLAEFTPCAQQVQSAASFIQADRLSESALNISTTTVLSQQEWQTLKSNLETAIATLQSIPAAAVAYPQAQSEVDRYQTKLSDITTRLQIEAAAVNAYLRAVQLIEQADAAVQTPTPATLSTAEIHVQEAIGLIQSVPGGTTISESTDVTIRDYQTKLTQIQNQSLSLRLTPLIEDFLTFATSLDTDMGYAEYNQKWNDLKTRFETQTQTSALLSDHPVVQALAIAVQQYDDALSIWRYCQEDNCSTSLQAGFLLESPAILWLPEDLDVQGKPLNQTYTIASTYSLLKQTRLAPLNSALRQIWQDAEQQIQDAKAQIPSGA